MICSSVLIGLMKLGILVSENVMLLCRLLCQCELLSMLEFVVFCCAFSVLFLEW